MTGGDNMKYYVAAELRESYPSLMGDNSSVYNDYISKKSINDLINAIKDNGYDCEYFGGINELHKSYIHKTKFDDAIFINYNYGLPYPYKRAQSPVLLEMLGVRYSGANPFTALLVNDKHFTKQILKNYGVKVSDDVILCNSDDVSQYMNKNYIKLPIVLKPNTEGSSLGIDDDCLCHNYNKAISKANKLLDTYSPIIAEQYIPGYELTVWIIGNKQNYKLIKPLLISYDGVFYFENKIFTLQDKATRKREYHLPEIKISDSELQKLTALSTEIFEALDMRDYARFDFRLNEDGIYFIEANALPIFSKTSEIGKICDLYNIEYNDICKKLIETISERFS